MDESLGRIFVEYHDEIDKTECCGNRSPGCLILNRSTGALEPASRSVGIDADDQPIDPTPAAPVRGDDRVDLVNPGPQVRGAELLGYIFDQAGVLYPMPVGPSAGGPSPLALCDTEGERGDNVPIEPPPVPAPNRLPEPADSGGGNLINVYA